MTITYTGDGRYLDGVPMRDLTDDEWAAIPADDRKQALKLGIYKEAAKQAGEKSPAKEK
jgi:hypothetical protein